MMMEQVITVELIDEGKNPLRIENIFVEVGLFTNGNYRYGFCLRKPTSADGQLHISYPDIEMERRESAQIFLMDYNTPLTDCDQRVRISIPSGASLKKAYEGIGRWFNGVVPEYANDWLTSNNCKIRATEVMTALDDRETLVQVSCVMV